MGEWSTNLLLEGSLPCMGPYRRNNWSCGSCLGVIPLMRYDTDF